MNPLVSYEFSEGIATLTMDDGKVNAMSVTMLKELNEALDRAETDKAVVILTGRERVFSGGFDLGAFKRGHDEIAQMLQGGAKLAERLLTFPRPVVAACNGHAVAMGAFLLLSTDLRIGVDQDIRVLINELQIGMTLPHFALEVCRQRLSPAHMHHAVLTAEPYSPQQAVVAGFFDSIVPAESLLATARTRAQALVKLHGGAFAATKLRLQRQTLIAMREAMQEDIEDFARFNQATTGKTG